MSTHAAGTFEVKLDPQSPQDDSGIGRMVLDKRFRGDLQATSKG